MPAIDLRFPILGQRIRVDHGYSLYSAICHCLPDLHHYSGNIGLHPVQGRLVGNRQLALDKQSAVVFRCDTDNIAMLLGLSGRSLQLDGHPVQVGVPQIHLLQPSPVLVSRLVLIKGFTEPESFLEAAQRQLNNLGVQAQPELVTRKSNFSTEGRRNADALRDSFVRRTLSVKGAELVGYSLLVRDLDAEDSLRVLGHGLGGRRRFGAGVFVGASA